jgi:radical SAM/Cys-rich protein
MRREKTSPVFEEMAGCLVAENLFAMQINMGRYCNQACIHCHVEASPSRQEMMSWSTMESILAVVENEDFETIELTGGAPELHPSFELFIERLSSLKSRIIVRSNLTALMEPGKKDLACFLHAKGVHLIASLPCFQEENVRIQRGEVVFGKSITALKMLNRTGYGVDNGLPLTLVFNPVGSFLPNGQIALEKLYRRELLDNYGITFTGLVALTNMPIGRFRQELKRNNSETKYMELLRSSFNKEIVRKVMCRSNMSVDWDGRLYDCDFNLAEQHPVIGTPAHISAFDKNSFAQRTIVTDIHCFGCTAGSGSSCHGALEVDDH